MQVWPDHESTALLIHYTLNTTWTTYILHIMSTCSVSTMTLFRNDRLWPHILVQWIRPAHIQLYLKIAPCICVGATYHTHTKHWHAWTVFIILSLKRNRVMDPLPVTEVELLAMYWRQLLQSPSRWSRADWVGGEDPLLLPADTAEVIP